MDERKSREAPAIVELADRIAEDIRGQGLGAGDAYLTTSEAAARFRVSGTTANRALQLLAQRGLLDRRQRAGTFVADPARRGTGPALRRVNLLVHREHLLAEGLLEDGVVLGLQGALPSADIRLAFLPSTDEDEYVGRLIAETLGAPGPEGFVLYRTSVRIQRAVRDSGLPAVVNGCLHPSVDGMAWIDRDQAGIGRLLVGHLLERGAKRLGILLRDRPTAGDAVLLDAAMASAGAAGLGADRVTVRFLPADGEAIRAAVAEMLPGGAGSGGAGTLGLLCRSEPLAAGAAAAVEAARLAGRKRPAIAVADVYRKDGSSPPFPHAVSALGPQELGREIGRMLAAQVGGSRRPAESVRIPVALRDAP
jgi:DNA-binding LacI/PurR family transcriptional regulator/DNA-binding transcriptional regulator YhcF (GntR family)